MKSQNILKKINGDNPKNYLPLDVNSNQLKSIVNEVPTHKFPSFLIRQTKVEQ